MTKFDSEVIPIASFIKNITCTNTILMKKKIMKRLDNMVEEEYIIDEIVEKWNTMVNESSYHELRSLLKERLNITDNDEIDTHVRLKTCYWAEECDCITDNNSFHIFNCENNKIWYMNDLDDYFGIELYKYDLIVGGPKHGTFIVNGNHEENDNEEDIEIKLDEFNKKFECIENLNNFVQDAFDQNKKIREYVQIHLKKLEMYEKKSRIKKITDLLKMIQKKYSVMIGYNKKSRNIYTIFDTKVKELITEAKSLINKNYDSEMNKLCEDLITIGNIVTKDMETWFKTIEGKVIPIFCKDISKYICNFI